MHPSVSFIITALVMVKDVLCQTCGVTLENHFSTRIVNGVDVKQGDFPWMVALMKGSPGVEDTICSAFMIGSLHALTAAHCFEDFENPRTELYSARIGSTHHANGTRYGIESIVIHGRYHYPLLYNDIAIIKLDREVQFPGFYPVCLPYGQSHISDLNTRLLTVTGWGFERPYGDVSPVLKRLSSIPVIAESECNAMYKGPTFQNQLPRGITLGILCAGFVEGGKDSCNGDSGGPLMVLDNNRWVVVGIVSFGPQYCGSPGFAAGHTRITFYRNWIQSKMQALGIVQSDKDSAHQPWLCDGNGAMCVRPKSCYEALEQSGQTVYCGRGRDKVCCVHVRRSHPGTSINFPRVPRSPTPDPPVRVSASSLSNEFQGCGLSQPLQSGSRSLRSTISPEQGEFSWMVTVLEGRRGWSAFCNGFMIDSRHVLTAAVCFEKMQTPDLYCVRIGDIYYATGLTYKIANITIHEGYRPGLFYDDIAVLTLEKDVDFPGFSPICLPDEELDRRDLENYSYTVASWGTKLIGDLNPVLLQSKNIAIIPNLICNAKFSKGVPSFLQKYPRGVTDKIICAGSLDTERIFCYGDAGSPLMLQKENHWIAVGITSFGIGCSHKFPIGYTRISSYLDWIRRKTQPRVEQLWK